MATSRLLAALVAAVTLAGTGASLAQAADNPLAGSEWLLVRVRSGDVVTAVGTTPEVTMLFDAAEPMVYGSAGCNRYNSVFELAEGEISFGAVISTMMFCEGAMERERGFLDALAEVEGYRRVGELLVLSGGANELTFVPLLQRPAEEGAEAGRVPATEMGNEAGQVGGLPVDDLLAQLTAEFTGGPLGPAHIIASFREIEDDKAAALAGPVPEPLRAVMGVFGMMPEGRSVMAFRRDSSPEAAELSLVTIMADGLRDDSVRSWLVRLLFARTPSGEWSLSAANESFRCYRGDSPDVFVAGPCP